MVRSLLKVPMVSTILGVTAYNIRARVVIIGVFFAVVFASACAKRAHD